MSAHIETLIYCDGKGCPREIPYATDFSDAGLTAAQQRRRYREHGWRFIEGEDFCPLCVERIKSGHNFKGMLKAWRGWCDGFDPFAVCALSRNAAHARAMQAAKAAGYSLRWGDIRLARARDLDYWAKESMAVQCVTIFSIEKGKP